MRTKEKRHEQSGVAVHERQTHAVTVTIRTPQRRPEAERRSPCELVCGTCQMCRRLAVR